MVSQTLNGEPSDPRRSSFEDAATVYSEPALRLEVLQLPTRTIQVVGYTAATGFLHISRNLS